MEEKANAYDGSYLTWRDRRGVLVRCPLLAPDGVLGITGAEGTIRTKQQIQKLCFQERNIKDEFALKIVFVYKYAVLCIDCCETCLVKRDYNE